MFTVSLLFLYCLLTGGKGGVLRFCWVFEGFSKEVYCLFTGAGWGFSVVASGTRVTRPSDRVLRPSETSWGSLPLFVEIGLGPEDLSRLRFLRIRS